MHSSASAPTFHHIGRTQSRSNQNVQHSDEGHRCDKENKRRNLK